MSKEEDEELVVLSLLIGGRRQKGPRDLTTITLTITTTINRKYEEKGKERDGISGMKREGHKSSKMTLKRAPISTVRTWKSIDVANDFSNCRKSFTLPLLIIGAKAASTTSTKNGVRECFPPTSIGKPKRQ